VRDEEKLYWAAVKAAERKRSSRRLEGQTATTLNVYSNGERSFMASGNEKSWNAVGTPLSPTLRADVAIVLRPGVSPCRAFLTIL
jgi:hypothetical protein